MPLRNSRYSRLRNVSDLDAIALATSLPAKAPTDSETIAKVPA